jgi:hypothetical protein
MLGALESSSSSALKASGFTVAVADNQCWIGCCDSGSRESFISVFLPRCNVSHASLGVDFRVLLLLEIRV